ncbi:MAG: peroxidase [Nonomuraea sp.]|nr:peroxidase [Nonomuraea sp.]
MDAQGYVANYTRVFALAPGVMQAWEGLAGTVRAGMDLRRYELATLAAARRLRSDYCSLAHGSVLLERFYDEKAVEAMATGHAADALEPVDVAIMDFATKVAADPAAVTAADVAELREHGLSEPEILQVVLAVCIRRFFSGVLSATGAEPDAFAALSPDLRNALTSDIP